MINKLALAIIIFAFLFLPSIDQPRWQRASDHYEYVVDDNLVGSYYFYPPSKIFRAHCGFDLLHGVDVTSSMEARDWVESRCKKPA